MTPELSEETVEAAAKIAESFGATYRVATPRSKSDARPRERFTAYDVDRHIRAAANMIAEDIRALISPPTKEGERP